MTTPLRVNPMGTPMRIDRNQPALSAPRPTSRRLPALAGATLILTMLLFFSFQLGNREVKALQQERVTLQDQVNALQAQQPSCDSYSREIGDLQQLINQGQFSMVQGMAQLYLNDQERPTCAEAKLALASLAYHAALDDLFLAPFDDHAATVRWQEAEHRADAYGLPETERTPAMSVVAQAYNAGLWELAHAAFLGAWSGNTVDQLSLKQVRLYYSILRNWGDALAARSDNDSHRTGLIHLRTASEISRLWGLHQGEAYQDLVGLLGPQSGGWPSPDHTDPVLARGMK